jgi:hypothetical protein
MNYNGVIVHSNTVAYVPTFYYPLVFDVNIYGVDVIPPNAGTVGAVYDLSVGWFMNERY